jgi:hypothetical protein
MFSGQVKEESLEELPFPLNLLPQELQLQQQQQLLAHLHLLQQNRQAPFSFDIYRTVKSLLRPNVENFSFGYLWTDGTRQVLKDMEKS